MHFRPYPVLTLLAIPALAALIALGVWQGQRAGWKAELIREFEAGAQATPLTPEAACEGGLQQGEILTPPQTSGARVRMFGQDASGRAGWRLLATADLCGAKVVVVAGFEALDIGGPGGRLPANALAQAPVTRFVVEPWPERPSMSADNNIAKNEWYWFDARSLQQALGVDSLDDRHVILPMTGVPSFLTRTPPETHIGYSVTWFGMAVAFLVIYGVFHARAGRLRFGKAGS